MKLLDNQVFTDSQARSTGSECDQKVRAGHSANGSSDFVGDPEAKAPPPKESHSKGMSKKTAYMICGKSIIQFLSVIGLV